MSNTEYSRFVKLESNQINYHNIISDPFNEKFDCSQSTPEHYRCKDCSFKSFYAINVKKHIKDLHDLDFNILTKYTCRRCYFQTYSILKRLHHSIKTGCPRKTEKIFECSECDHATLIKQNLRSHILSKHTSPFDVKWFKCDHCDFKSKFKMNLKRHVIIKHTIDEIRWFKCDHCNYQSKHKIDLKRHVMKQHTTGDIRWFQCDHCQYKSIVKSHLKGHALQHKTAAEIRWLKCDHCQYKSKYKGDLNKHIMRKHNSN